MPRVYMQFEWLGGWRVRFLVNGRILPRTLLFRSDEKLLEMAARGGALQCLADRQALEHAMVQGGGGVHLELSHPQMATLQRESA